MLKLISETGDGGMGLAGLGGGAGLDGGTRLNRLTQQVGGQVGDPLQVESVKKLEGENQLLQLHLTVHSGEDAGAAGHRQIRILVGEISSLHRDVTVVSKVEAVNRLVPVSFLLRLVLDQNAYPRCDPQSFLKVPRI